MCRTRHGAYAKNLESHLVKMCTKRLKTCLSTLCSLPQFSSQRFRTKRILYLIPRTTFYDVYNFSSLNVNSILCLLRPKDEKRWNFAFFYNIAIGSRILNSLMVRPMVETLLYYLLLFAYVIQVYNPKK